MRIRKGLPEERDEIYRMGYDVWGAGHPIDVYLERCRNSPKYRQGHWYVLAMESGVVCSSLIRYSMSADTCGFGSISTPPSLRNRGYASELITQALRLSEDEGFSVTYLFSDIAPGFYEKFGFAALPGKHQMHPGSVCMVRGIRIQLIEEDVIFQPPAYF